MTRVTRPATGFASASAPPCECRRNEIRSRVAANPIPRTNGSLAVKVKSYNRAGSNPLRRQIFLGSGRPGNGTVAQSAHAQSVLEIGVTCPGVPSFVSEDVLVNVAFVVSRENGRYGTARCSTIRAEVLPFVLTNRCNTRPLISE